MDPFIGVAASRSTTPTSPAIAQPGKNCWRVDRAHRFYCVQDGADYFSLVRRALLRARHTIFILGWDVSANVDLLMGTDQPREPRRLDELLTYVAQRRPHLRCYILIWDYSALYTLERDLFSRWKLGWRTPRRVKFGFDDRIPFGGSHHQKLVVVDDSLAFCGGIDLTDHRWDTSAHRVDEPARIGRGGPYGPYHEVQAMADGALAASLGELARDRWRAIGETRLPPIHRSSETLWPDDIEPDLREVDVAIARTLPGTETQPAIRECEALFFDSIARARRSIYIESQYFTSDTLGDALAARLHEADGPEVVIVSPSECHGWLEQNTMGAFRNRLFHRLIAADRYRRLRLVHPAASRSRGVPTFVHSKVMIVDDELMRIGSANFSRRSMSVDSECDLAAEAAGDPGMQAGIRHIRDRLLAEHLGAPVAEISRELDRGMSLRALVDSRAGRDRTLARLSVPEDEGTTPSEALRAAADPEEPLLSDSAIANGTPPLDGASHLAAVVGYFVLFPLELVAVAAGIWLGFLQGGLFALLASLIAAIAGYGAGRRIGVKRLRRWMTTRAYRSVRQLGAGDVIDLIVLQLAWVASGGSIHALCGAARVPFGKYLVGTLIGSAAPMFALSALGALIRQAIRYPTMWNALAAFGAAMLFLAAAAALRTLLLFWRIAPSVITHRRQAEFG
jgi:phosphatidylserine/phosphatidylglycerophosphate/cardiolipin synthase-like enzyme/uncharacterized membrane protein YdjX (TVP38/TMEM64 family)